MANFNARSIRNEHRQNTLLHSFQTGSQGLMVVTETWLDHKLQDISNKLQICQSPPKLDSARGEGVLIISKKRNLIMEPLFEDYWTSQTVAARISLKEGVAIIIGHYTQMKSKASSDEELLFFWRNVSKGTQASTSSSPATSTGRQKKCRSSGPR